MSGETARLPVPFSMLAAYEVEPGLYRVPAAGPLSAASAEPLRLRLGDHDLGSWLVVQFDVEHRRAYGGGRLFVMLRQVPS